jgi:hypothetical protein
MMRRSYKRSWIRFALTGGLVGGILGILAVRRQEYESGVPAVDSPLSFLLLSALGGGVAGSSLLVLRQVSYYWAWAVAGLLGGVVLELPVILLQGARYFELVAIVALSACTGVSLGYTARLVLGKDWWSTPV